VTRTGERDTAVRDLTTRTRERDAAVGDLATRTRERDDARKERDAAQTDLGLLKDVATILGTTDPSEVDALLLNILAAAKRDISLSNTTRLREALVAVGDVHAAYELRSRFMWEKIPAEVRNLIDGLRRSRP
jgi:hypothetical protein